MCATARPDFLGCGSAVPPDPIPPTPQPPPGQYILHVVGTLSTGSFPTVNTGLTVRNVDRRAIVIRGRRGKRVHSGRVFIYGRTWGLDGKQARARVNLQGQTKHVRGSLRAVKEGHFTWQRKSTKKAYVDFHSSGVRSQRIIISKR